MKNPAVNLLRKPASLWLDILVCFTVWLHLLLWFLVFQPPLQLYGVDGRYAHALFSAASKTDSLPKVEKEVAAFRVCIRSLHDAESFACLVSLTHFYTCSRSCLAYSASRAAH